MRADAITLDHLGALIEVSYGEVTISGRLEGYEHSDKAHVMAAPGCPIRHKSTTVLSFAFGDAAVPARASVRLLPPVRG